MIDLQPEFSRLRTALSKTEDKPISESTKTTEIPAFFMVVPIIPLSRIRRNSVRMFAKPQHNSRVLEHHALSYEEQGLAHQIGKEVSPKSCKVGTHKPSCGDGLRLQE